MKRILTVQEQKLSVSYATSYLHLNKKGFHKIRRVVLKKQVGSRLYFPFRLYGKNVLLDYTIISTTIFLATTNEHRNVWNNKLLRCMCHLFSIIFIRVASHWHFRQMDKVHWRTQVWNIFCMGKGSSFPSYGPRRVLTTSTISNIYWLHSCVQLFVTVPHPSLQNPAQHNVSTCSIIFKNWGKEMAAILILIFWLQARGKFTFLMHFYSVIFYSLFVFPLFRRK